MFRGVSALALDGKGRLAIPARHRERIMELSEGQMVVTVDRDYCLLLYPLPEWESLERKLTQLSSLNPTIRRLQRLYIGHATDVDMDGSGRILLPQPLREFAGLDRRTVLVGQGNKFEIWDEDRWNSNRELWFQEEAEGDGELPAELEGLSL
ncbi:MraZ protein [Thiohalospira halophila DSM 15071]|uniref:Transcriptional regulator MraZ n=1 Tax=Thiohalospira halophila DSM 15071 TaxID=1123397 RepID=A0A1I1QZ45_9GAMM|nr:division/cell wall cluster transcriptional repressor MraZ [Thiohalospira halophila]SFD25138.1 MraZ protein [Thiohalospira halophila DSM 15071]